jgi:hypothetical protein
MNSKTLLAALLALPMLLACDGKEPASAVPPPPSSAQAESPPPSGAMDTPPPADTAPAATPSPDAYSADGQADQPAR